MRNFEITIAVTDAAWGRRKHYGAMRRASSCEDLHKVWFGMHNASQFGTSEDKRFWAKVRRNICCRFIKLSDQRNADGVEFINGQAREDRKDEADLTDWSPVQRVQFVQSQKKRLADKKSKTLDQITVQQTFNHLKRLNTASRSEDYAIGFTQACGLVAKNMLSIDGVYDLLGKLMEPKRNANGDEETLPIDSVYQLQLICQAGGSPMNVKILLNELNLQYKVGVLNRDDFSQRKIKISCDIILVQMQAPNWLQRWMARHQFPDSQVSIVHAKFTSEPEALAKTFEMDLAWQSDLWGSAQQDRKSVV